MDRDVATLESLGDRYSSDGDHRAAMKSYQSAFDICAEDVTAHTRLAFKVGRSAFHRGIGSDADEWFNVSLDAPLPEATIASVAHVHLQQMRALWSNSRTSDVVAFAEGILDAATRSNNTALILATRLSLATVLHLLTRHGEGDLHLRAIDVREISEDHKLLCMYHRVSGMAFTAAGNSEHAFESFAKALHHAEQDRDVYATTSILLASAICASAFGRIEFAAGSIAHALHVARENNLFWNVAYISLEYARVLGRQGKRHLAHAYVLQASTVEDAPPVLIEALAEIGIPIALECDDADLLEQCANRDALAFAFRSGEPPRFGPVASSLARYYCRKGRLREAQAVLGRALAYVTKAEQNYDLAVASAEFGHDRHLASAREILRTRTLLPNAEVALAHLSYFDALVFKREGRARECLREATVAATLFRELRWTSHELAATSLCKSVARDVAKVKTSDDAVALVPSELTPREQSVARLAIAGLSNQEIADALAISARTVESHMTSILRRTGLQSRHQLLGALSG
ncbi:MAG: helix-turn-helix transcriptional regulator [Candidatus Eremiobacteraeota bacterium]|nr:helix-turn-helix transcriptional regulator [Candidatus Eremiobacteraeota bacterium]